MCFIIKTKPRCKEGIEEKEKIKREKRRCHKCRQQKCRQHSCCNEVINPMSWNHSIQIVLIKRTKMKGKQMKI